MAGEEPIEAALAETLVREGWLGVEHLRVLLHCPACAKNYRVKNLSPGATVLCPSCSVALSAPSVEASIDGAAAVASPPAAGDASHQTFGRYKLLEQLGKGGMGIVWKAWDSQLKRAVALKQIIGEEDADQIERFMREARAAAALRHPNIVPIHDVGVEGGKHYFTMDFIEGASLKDKKPAPREALSIVRDVARALHHAHEQGIVHRDVKPANILLDAKGTPYVTDFGLAKDIKATGITMSGQLLGTPSYMSPEQAAGSHAIGPASDQFSLGVTLYELLAGSKPFPGENIHEILSDIIDKEPPRMTGVHRDLETICLKSLEKIPAKRYASLKDFADDIARYLDGEPILARPISIAERLWRKAAKRRAVVVAGGLGLVAVIVTASILVPQWFREKRRAQKAEREKAVESARAAALREADEVYRQAGRNLYVLRMREYNRDFRMGEKEFDEYRRIVERCSEQMGKTGDSAEGWWAVGRARDVLGDTQGAKEAYAAGLMTEPGHLPCALDRARILIEAALMLRFSASADPGWQRKAEEALGEALRGLKAVGAGTNEKNFELDLATGYQLVVRGQPAEEYCARKFQEWEGHDFREEFLLIRGLAQWDRLVDDATEAIRARPAFYAAFFWLGAARSNLGDFKGAIEDCDEALKIDPRFANAYVNRGVAKQGLGDFKGEIEDYTEALKIDPRDANAYYNRGAAREAMSGREPEKSRGHLAAAEADYARCLEVARADWPHRKDVESRLQALRARLKKDEEY